MKNFSRQKRQGQEGRRTKAPAASGTTSNHRPEVKRKILVVGKDYAFTTGWWIMPPTSPSVWGMTSSP